MVSGAEVLVSNLLAVRVLVDALSVVERKRKK